MTQQSSALLPGADSEHLAVAKQLLRGDKVNKSKRKEVKNVENVFYEER